LLIADFGLSNVANASLRLAATTEPSSVVWCPVSGVRRLSSAQCLLDLAGQGGADAGKLGDGAFVSDQGARPANKKNDFAPPD